MSSVNVDLSETVRVVMNLRYNKTSNGCVVTAIFDLLKHFNAPTRMYDEVLQMYINSLSPGSSSVIFDLLECEVFCSYASTDKVEAIIAIAVRHGALPLAQRLSEVVDRRLTDNEIIIITRQYTNGALCAAHQETALLGAARSVGGEELKKLVQNFIDEQHERLGFA